MGTIPNRVEVEGVTVNRGNYLNFLAGDESTNGTLANYVASVIARQRGETVVTFRHESTSLSGGEVDAEVYTLTTGKWYGPANAYSINYRQRWLYISAADAELVAGWANG